MTIVNDDSRVITKLETSVTDDTRVVIYDHHMFIVQATDINLGSILLSFLGWKKWTQRPFLWYKSTKRDIYFDIQNSAKFNNKILNFKLRTIFQM
jgi:hypothetical protein